MMVRQRLLRHNHRKPNPIFSSSDVTTSTSAPLTTSRSTISSVELQTSTPQSPEKPSEIPISAPNDSPLATSIPTPDPYFTHFDPRMEHQSYKVGLDVKTLNIFTLIEKKQHDATTVDFSRFPRNDALKFSIFSLTLNFIGSSTASRGKSPRKSD